MDDGITIPPVPLLKITPVFSPITGPVFFHIPMPVRAREAEALCAAASPVQRIRTEARRSIMGMLFKWLCA